MIKDGPSGRWDWRPACGSSIRPMSAPTDSPGGTSRSPTSIAGSTSRTSRWFLAGGSRAGCSTPGRRCPSKRLDLTIGSPPGAIPGSTVYARTDDEGRFTSEPLFPGEYVVDVNSTELGHPVLGRVQIEAKKTLEKEFLQDKLKWAIAMGVTAVNGKNRIEGLQAFTMTTRETDDDGRKSTTKHFILLPDRYRSETRFDGDDKTRGEHLRGRLHETVA